MQSQRIHKMNLKPTKPLSGIIELLPAEQRCFDECARRMQDVLRRAGFVALGMPTMERAEVLTDKENWDEITTQMYLFEKGDTKIGLRYDGTIGLARYVAGHANDLAFPFRAMQLAKNFRAERAQRGRYREFWQMDADILGINSLSTNYYAEIIAVFSMALSSIQEFIGPHNIRIGARNFWDAVFEHMGLDDDTARQVFVLIDKKEKITPAEFDAEMRKILTDDVKADDILSIFSNGYAAMAGKSEALDKAGREIDEFMEIMDAMGVKNAKIDLSIMRGHGYYTGFVFETFLDNHPDLGSICGGGGYENLASKFSKTKIVGFGGAIGVSRMLVPLIEEGKIDLAPFQAAADVAVLVMNQDCVAYAIKIVSDLRAAGVVAAPFLDVDKKFKNQMEFADKINCKYSIIIGEDEVKNNTAMIKNMDSGEQTNSQLHNVINVIKSKI